MAKTRTSADIVLLLVAEIVKEKPAFYYSDIYVMAQARQAEFPELVFGLDGCCEKIENGINALLATNRLLINPLNSSLLVTRESLKALL